MYRSYRSKIGYIATGHVTVAFRLPIQPCYLEITDDDERAEEMYEEIAEHLENMYDADDFVETDYIKIKKKELQNDELWVEGTAEVHATVRVGAYDREDAYEKADEEVFSNESIITDILDADWEIEEDEPDWEEDD